MNETQLNFRKTRIAPTPSGFLHIGNLYAFALTAAIARRHNASILLRIDDLDRQRVHEKYITDIFETLSFMEIPWDEGPRNLTDFEQNYSQLRRLELYNNSLNDLRENGLVYACRCSRADHNVASAQGCPGSCREEHIPLDIPDVAWRLDTSTEKKIRVHLLNGEVTTHTLPPEQRDFIVKRRDGLPAYQLSSVVDDLYFGVDLIVRGADLWSSTIAQLYLAQLLQYNRFLSTAFYHHELLRNESGEKLSKSAGHTSVQDLRKNFKTNREVYAMMGRLTGQKLTCWQELIL